jgi:transposase
MLIIGCDFHPGFQQVAIFDNLTGEIQEKRLQHRAEAEQFYRGLAGQEVRVGMEACGHYPWFERLLAELGFELWFGDAAKVRASVVRKQKTDRRDAEHLLDLLRENRFPRIWVPSLEVRDVRQLLVRRHKQVQARTRTKNQLQAMALSQGVQKKYKLWTKAGREELEQLPLLPYAAQRRKQLLQSLDGLEAEISELDRRVADEARQRPEAVRLMTHPGVGPVTALALVLTLGPADRFESAKQVGSYFGLIPSEDSSGGKQRLGRISKQGSSFLRFLLVEAGQTAARLDPQLKRFYRRLAARKNRSVAKVAVARKLATRLYLMLREDWTYTQLCQAVMQVSPSHSVAASKSRALEWAACLPEKQGDRTEQSWALVPKRWMVEPEVPLRD